MVPHDAVACAGKWVVTLVAATVKASCQQAGASNLSTRTFPIQSVDFNLKLFKLGIK